LLMASSPSPNQPTHASSVRSYPAFTKDGFERLKASSTGQNTQSQNSRLTLFKPYQVVIHKNV
jgi:hypothetical protein